MAGYLLLRRCQSEKMWYRCDTSIHFWFILTFSLKVKQLWSFPQFVHHHGNHFFITSQESKRSFPENTYMAHTFFHSPEPSAAFQIFKTDINNRDNKQGASKEFLISSCSFVTL